MTPPKNQIKVVIADAGPLISLAYANALDTLLVFKDNVRVVITDYVWFEVSRNRDQFADAKRICDFLTRYNGTVEIQETLYGKSMIQLMQLKQKFDDDASFRNIMKQANVEP